jgi:hypothetical protein
VFRAYKVVADVSAAANERTFAQIMKEFNHTHIEFLKIDIDWSEFTVMPKIFDEIKVCKLLFVYLVFTMSEQTSISMSTKY